MKVIGLTGGIGSGKSLVAKILKGKYGACILDTDGIAKQQMEPGGISYVQVVEYFGKDILLGDTTIDRTKLAETVFRDPMKRLKINEITHPNVLTEVEAEINTSRAAGNIPYLVVETALMIEAEYDYICDEVWYVFSPEATRRLRLKKERSYSDDKIDAIFANQSKEEAFRKKFSRVIENTGDIAALETQVARLIQG